MAAGGGLEVVAGSTGVSTGGTTGGVDTGGTGGVDTTAATGDVVGTAGAGSCGGTTFVAAPVAIWVVLEEGFAAAVPLAPCSTGRAT